MDWAITDTLLITLRGDGLGIVEDGAVGVEDDEVTYVGPSADLDAGDATTIDGSGRLTMPGLVDAHSHMGLTLLRGGAQDVPEIEWMNDALGPLAAHLDAEDHVLGTRLGVLEAVGTGTTTVVEYAANVDRLVEAVYRDLGVRVVATETINEVPADRSGHDPREPYPFDRDQGDAALARADGLFEAYGDDPLVFPAYGPQAVDMVSPDLLETVVGHAAARDAAVHVHVAQGERERLQVGARYGDDASSVSVLEDLGVLDGHVVAAHCHGTTPEERAHLVDRGVNLVACPSSIGMIDGIVPPVADYHDRGGTVGIGTDQAPGAGHNSMLREARTAALLSKVNRTDPTSVPAWRALRMATVGGAEALGLADRIGRLAPGYQADVVTVDLEELGVAPTVGDPLQTAVPNVVYSAPGAAVRDVFVAGDPLVRDGEFVVADPAATVAEARERARAVFEAAGDDWRAAGSELVRAADAGWLSGTRN